MVVVGWVSGRMHPFPFPRGGGGGGKAWVWVWLEALPRGRFWG